MLKFWVFNEIQMIVEYLSLIGQKNTVYNLRFELWQKSMKMNKRR